MVMSPSIRGPAVSDQRPRFRGEPPDEEPPATAAHAWVMGARSGPPTVPWQLALPFTVPVAKPLAVYCGNVPTASQNWPRIGGSGDPPQAGPHVPPSAALAGP